MSIAVPFQQKDGTLMEMRIRSLVICSLIVTLIALGSSSALAQENPPEVVTAQKTCYWNGRAVCEEEFTKVRADKVKSDRIFPIQPSYKDFRIGQEVEASELEVYYDSSMGSWTLVRKERILKTKHKIEAIFKDKDQIRFLLSGRHEAWREEQLSPLERKEKKESQNFGDHRFPSAVESDQKLLNVPAHSEAPVASSVVELAK